MRAWNKAILIMDLSHADGAIHYAEFGTCDLVIIMVMLVHQHLDKRLSEKLNLPPGLRFGHRHTGIESLG
jgi:hypothetical protein